MQVTINNCNNIDFGQIEINSGCLNIKYAINGTGKSTTSKAIEAAVTGNQALLDELVPYKHLHNPDAPHPTVAGLEDIHSVCIFNEEYVNRHVFTATDLIENSFSIFVKTPKYDEHMAKIEQLLIDVADAFKNHPELDELINVFSEFIKSFGSSQAKMSKSSPIAKAFGNGNKLKHIPDGLEKYTPYLLHSHDAKNVTWLKWQMAGKEYLDMAEQCPYCTASILDTKEQIEKVAQEYGAKDIEHLNKLLELFENLMPYFSDATSRKIREIRDNISEISDQQKNFLIGVRSDIQNLLDQLTKVKSISYRSLRTADKISDELKNFIIDLSCYVHLSSALTQSKVDLINSTMEKVIEVAGKLQGEVRLQNDLIANTIKTNKDTINTFLSKAGYRYAVDIIQENGDYKMILKPTEVEYEVESVKTHLSYGEKNALALALFTFSAKKINPDLIILDDPISSFDGNKKFALIDLLFLSKGALRNKTVVLLTHEFNSVIDIMKTKIREFNPKPSAAFLTTKSGVLSEKTIKREDICTIQRIAENNIQAIPINLLKIIYLRRIYEVNDDKSLIWQMTSSLLHRKPIARIDTETDNRQMTLEEISEATLKIQDYIPNFDYNTEYNNATNVQFLKDLYNTSPSNFEKLQIFRILFDAEPQDSIIKKFINETYHVGNDYVYQLNPREFDTIPQYVIDFCDSKVRSLG